MKTIHVCTTVFTQTYLMRDWLNIFIGGLQRLGLRLHSMVSSGLSVGLNRPNDGPSTHPPHKDRLESPKSVGECIGIHRFVAKKRIKIIGIPTIDQNEFCIVGECIGIHCFVPKNKEKNYQESNHLPKRILYLPTI